MGRGRRSGVALGPPGDPTRPCVPEGVALTPRSPWGAVKGSKHSLRVNPGPSGKKAPRSLMTERAGCRVTRLRARCLEC
jgi:hypothetical protein